MFPRPVTVSVDDTITHQTIMGFGGAITGAVGYNLHLLPLSSQQRIIETYFSDKTGIGYTMIRMSIGGSDFDEVCWAYNETPEDDLNLSNFTHLDPRQLLSIANIKMAKEVLDREGRQLKISAATWGAPKWMRDPKRWGNQGFLRPEFYATWAEYHMRFMKLLREEAGLDLWSISTGNEPSNSIIGWTPWIALGWKPNELGRFMAEHLGPRIRNSQFKDVKILVGDDQRFMIPWFYPLMKKAYPEAFDYIDGFAMHAYFDMFGYDLQDMLQEQFPDKFAINTEYSTGGTAYWPKGPFLGSWDRGVNLIKNYIPGLAHHLTGWIDWNIVLDQDGGPNVGGNIVDSPIIVNATNGEFYKQPMFYVIGHFSKFITEGSVRIGATSSWKEIHTVAFRRPDNTNVVLLYNNYVEPVQVTLNANNGRTRDLVLPASSLSTVIYLRG